jgi:alpha-1,3-rhamnosyl/mannosyltransferase
MYLRWSSRRALKKGSAILVPTQAVKEDLLHFYEADPKKIHVVPHGPLPLSWPEKSTAPENPYFLFVGRLEEKKNLETLISGWGQIHTSFPKLKLLLGGKPGHGYEKIHAAWEASPARSSIELMGYLPEESVAVLMKNAQALILPSLDEGFGFPLLQAFEAECPVICSDIPALREVAGDAALFFPSMEAGALAQAMEDLLKNPDLAENLREKGIKQLAKFSWGKAGREVLSELN